MTSMFALNILFLFALSLCGERLERPNKASRIFRIVFSLTLEIILNLLRLGLHLCHAFCLIRTATLSSRQRRLQDFTEAISLQTAEETCITNCLLESQSITARTHNLHTALIQKQTALFMAKSQQADLDRRNLNAGSRPEGASGQNQALIYSVAHTCQEYDRLYALTADEMRIRLEILAQRRSETPQDRTEAEDRIVEVMSQLHATEDLQHCVLRAIDGLNAARQVITAQLDASRHQLSEAKVQVAVTQRMHDSIREGSKRLEAKRILVIRSLLVSVLVFSSFSRYLGERLAPAMRWKSFLLSKVRLLSAQKSRTQGALLRSLIVNVELRDQLATARPRVAALEEANLDWQRKHRKSEKAREIAAKKFKNALQETIRHHKDTSTQFLNGILFLWRLNLYLSQQLAESRSILLAIEGIPPDVGPRTVHYEEEISTPVQDSFSPSRFSDPSDDRSVTTEASVTQRSIGIVAAENGIQPFKPASSSSLVTKRRSLRHESCAVDTSDLPTNTAEIAIMTEHSSEQEDLRQRVERLQQKIHAMETVDALHRGFLNTLVVKTKPDCPPSNVPSEGSAPVSVSPSAGPIPRARRPTFVAGPNPMTRTKPTRIFSQPLDKLPFPLSNNADIHNASPSAASRIGRSSFAAGPPFLLNIRNSSFS